MNLDYSNSSGKNQLSAWFYPMYSFVALNLFREDHPAVKRVLLLLPPPIDRQRMSSSPGLGRERRLHPLSAQVARGKSIACCNYFVLRQIE
jgi:hypothetical protein